MLPERVGAGYKIDPGDGFSVGYDFYNYFSMNTQEPSSELKMTPLFKGFSFGDFMNESETKISSDIEMLAYEHKASELFSLFTADIIKQDVIFTR